MRLIRMHDPKTNRQLGRFVGLCLCDRHTTSDKGMRIVKRRYEAVDVCDTCGTFIFIVPERKKPGRR